MARFKSAFRRKALRAKYVCPECGRVGYYRCHLDGPGQRIRGRPREDYCPCGARTEYRGLVSTYKGTVPYAAGGRRMLACRDCDKAIEHACMREGGEFWRCLSCGRQRLLEDGAERERHENPIVISAEDIWGR